MRATNVHDVRQRCILCRTRSTRGAFLQPRRPVLAVASGNAQMDEPASPRIGFMLELDGCGFDIHNEGHRWATWI